MPQQTKTAFAAFAVLGAKGPNLEEMPIAVCETEATAFRKAKNRNALGGDGIVREVTLTEIDGFWYGPVAIIPPHPEDQQLGSIIGKRRAAIAKAKSKGLTDTDIEDIQLKPEV